MKKTIKIVLAVVLIAELAYLAFLGSIVYSHIEIGGRVRALGVGHRDTEFMILVVNRQTQTPMPGVKVKVLDWSLKEEEVMDKAKTLITDENGKVSVRRENNVWTSSWTSGIPSKTTETPSRNFTVQIRHPWFKWIDTFLGDFEFENQGTVEGSQWYRVEIRIPLEATK